MLETLTDGAVLAAAGAAPAVEDAGLDPGKLILVAVALLAAYWAACAFWPYLSCKRCGGSGKLRNPFSGRGWRTCPRCTGKGRRVRLGRRIYEGARGL